MHSTALLEVEFRGSPCQVTPNLFARNTLQIPDSPAKMFAVQILRLIHFSSLQILDSHLINGLSLRRDFIVRLTLLHYTSYIQHFFMRRSSFSNTQSKDDCGSPFSIPDILLLLRFSPSSRDWKQKFVVGIICVKMTRWFPVFRKERSRGARSQTGD